MTRGRTSLRQRRARLRAKAWQVGQCAIAAGVAWTIATELFHHQRAFFAPVAAVVCLGTSYGSGCAGSERSPSASLSASSSAT